MPGVASAPCVELVVPGGTSKSRSTAASGGPSLGEGSGTGSVGTGVHLAGWGSGWWGWGCGPLLARSPEAYQEPDRPLKRRRHGLCATYASPLARPVRTLIRAAPARPRRGPHPQARALRKIPWPGPLPPSPASCRISHHPDLMGNPTSPHHPHGKHSHCIQRAASSSGSRRFS